MNLFYFTAVEREREITDKCDYLLQKIGLITNILWGDLGPSVCVISAIFKCYTLYYLEGASQKT